ncbi:MAG: extracellular solute-binding protein [Chloroflexi bacterium]|nr:extracellular solute-binding protein [Chloroflexota bacterium]
MAGAALPMLLEACGSSAVAPASGSGSPAASGGAAVSAQPSGASSGSASASAATSAAAKPATSGSASPAANAASSPKAQAGLPSYIPLANKPKPDFPSMGVLYEDGYINYPANPAKSVPQAPGKGGPVTIFVQPLQPASSTLDQNPAWQAVNKDLNATITFNLAPAADYQAKLATVMASNDLPDVLNLFRGLTGAPNAPQFLQNSCADLTPFLAGDAVKDYPNLAAIPTFAWKNSGSLINGKLYMVPVERYAPGSQLYKDVGVYDKEIGAGYVPKNTDDVKRIMAQINSPSTGRYATGSYQSVAYDIDWWKSVFASPNNWRLESDGKLTKDFETPEYKEAVGFLRDLVTAGYFHPNTPTYTSIAQSTVEYTSGKWVLYVNAFGVSWGQIWRYGLARKPPEDYAVIDPFAAHDGQKPVHHLSLGFQSATALKKASADRVKELLGILNYLAAPFGSQEDLLLTSGVKGTDYNFDPNGNPVLTDRGNLDANNVPWKYVVQHPQVMYTPDIPKLSQLEYEAEKVEIPLGISDPTLGYYSSTMNSKGIPITKAYMDGLTEILAGRQPLATFDQLVKDWQNNGGNTIRTEFQQAIAAAS